MDDVTNKLLAFGRDKIPSSVKDDAYQEIKNQLESDPAYKRFIEA